MSPEDIRNLIKLAVVALILAPLLFVILKSKRSWFRTANLSNRTLAIVALIVLCAPAAYRLALIPMIGIPEPMVHDEFVHLLVADTLLSGRFANPPHPLFEHFDTTYVLQHPAYAGVYPIGKGMVFAAGKALTGNPWFGLVLITPLMSLAIAWVLWQLLPPRWALMAAVPVSFSYGLQWINSYWGGTFCALGGALMFGAMLRFQKQPSPAMGLVAGLGWTIVWLIRPFESVLLFILLWVSVTLLIIRGRKPLRSWIWPVLMICAPQLGGAAITALHNRATTGSLLMMPQQLDQKLSGVPQTFAWQAAVPEPKYRFPEMKRMYLWQLKHKQLNVFQRAGNMGQALWMFYLTPWFALPLALSLIGIREKSVATAWGLLVCGLSISLLYPFFAPHYFAAYSCCFAYLIARGLIVLSKFDMRILPSVGVLAVLFLIVGGTLQQPITMLPLRALVDGSWQKKSRYSRESITRQFLKTGGRHVVFVRYGSHHVFHYEWIYNAANIDGSPVVWCRWLGINSDREVMNYYPDREYWTVYVDSASIQDNQALRLSPYGSSQ